MFLLLQNIFITHISRSFFYIFCCISLATVADLDQRWMLRRLTLPVCLAHAGRHSDVQWSSHQLKLGQSCSHKRKLLSVKILYFLILLFRRSLCGLSKNSIFIVKGVWVEWILVELKFYSIFESVYLFRKKLIDITKQRTNLLKSHNKRKTHFNKLVIRFSATRKITHLF
jgi:hypothetical protein